MAVPRGSIFGALLLISIGALFLWANLDPAVRPWYLIGRYWPILVIFWGLSKLVDYLSLRGTPEAARAARLSGGDIFLLIIILIVGPTVTAVTQRVGDRIWDRMGIHIEDEEWAPWFGQRYEFTQQLEQAVKTPGFLSVSTTGNVTLVAREGDRLQAKIRKRVLAPNAEEAERRARDVEFVFEPIAGPQPGSPAGYELRLRRSGDKPGVVRADIELSVPPRLSARIESGRGDVHVDGLQGDLNVTLRRGDAELATIHGNVEVRARGGAVRIQNVRGDVLVRGSGDEITVRDVRGQARIEGEFVGPIRAGNISGETRFVSRRTDFTAERVEGELELVRGDLNLRRAVGNVTLIAEDKDIFFDELAGALRCQNRTGVIKLRFAQPPRDPIDIESRNGDIELLLPANSSFTIDARAPSGEIISDFTGSGLNLKSEAGGATLSGTQGSRGPAIRLHTRYGTIRLLRATPATSG